MRKLSYIGAAVLLAACALAGPLLQRSETSSIVMTNITGKTNTITTMYGYIEEINVSCSDGVSTGAVVIALQAPESTVTQYNLATNSIVSSKVYRPRVDATDGAGAALTSDPPVRYCLMGESIKWAVTASPSNVTWTLRVKLSDN